MAHSTPDQSLGSYAALLPMGTHAKLPPIPIKKALTVIGSRKEVVRIHLESSTVSKVHCAIVLNDWGCYVRDLASRTHTLVNGQPVDEADLKDGDILQVGRFQFKYVAPNFVAPRVNAVDGELLVSTLTDPLPIRHRMIQIGRRPGSDLQFDDSKVSNVHALLFVVNDGWQVRDLGSRTGVWLNGGLVRQELVDDGAQMKIGGATLIFRHRHLDEAEDELDLAAPLTLAEAPAAPVAPGNDLASPPALEPMELEPLEAADDAPSETGSIAGADAMASLRRDWRQPSAEAPSEIRPPKPRPATPPKVEPPPAPLNEDSVADLLAEVPTEPEPVDLADLLAESAAPATAKSPEPVKLQPDNPAKAPPAARHEPAIAPVPQPKTEPKPAAEIEPDVEIVAEAPQPIEAPAIELPPEPLEFDDLQLDEAVAETPTTPDPVIDELPPEPEVVVEPIAEAPAAVEPEAEAELELNLELEPLELDEEIAESPEKPAALRSAPDAEAIPEPATPEPEPALELDTLELDEAVLDEVDLEEPAPSEAIAEAPAAEFDFKLEPLELDEDAEPELAAPAPGEAFPADEAVAESTPAIDPVLDEAPAEAEPELELGSLTLPPVAKAPTPAAAPADEFDLELEPLELDEDADEVLAAPAAGATFPADPAADDIAPVVDELPPAEVAAIAPEAELDLDDLLIDEAPAEATDEATEPDAKAYEPATVEISEVAPSQEAVEIAALGDEPEPIEELADIEFDLELDSPVAAAPAAEAVEAADDDVDIFTDAPVDEPAEAVAEIPAPVTPVAKAPGETIVLDEEAEEIAQETESLGTIRLTAGVVSDEDALDFLDDEVADEAPVAEPPAADAPSVTAPTDAAEIKAPASPISADTLIIEEPVGEETVADAIVDETDEDDLDLLEAKDDAGELAIEDLESAKDKIIPPAVYFEERAAEIGLSLSTVDEDHEPLDESKTDTAMALDLSAFIDKPDEDEPEWEDAPAAPEPVMDAGHDTRHGDEPPEIAPPTGGSLRDLIPSGPPLMGGMFTPAAPMAIGGSPVLNFNAAPPAAPAQPNRRRPLRTSFGRSSPFAAQSTTIGEAARSDVVESVDVFSSPSPTEEDLKAIGGITAEVEMPTPAPTITAPPSPAPASNVPTITTLAPVEDEASSAEILIETAPVAEAPLDRPLLRPSEEDEIRAVAEMFRPRVPAELTAARAQQMLLASAEEAATLRRKRYRRIMACLIATAVLVPGGVIGVYSSIKQYSQIDATITYPGLDNLGVDDARSFRQTQNDLVLSEQIRQNAIGRLPANVLQGFLADPKQMQTMLDSDPTVRWPAEQPAMRLRINSTDKAGDISRIRALAETIIASSSSKQKQLDELQDRKRRDTVTVNSLQGRKQDIESQLQDIQQAGNNRPNLATISDLRQRRDDAEKALTAIKSSRQEIEASVQVLQRPGNSSAAPMTSADPNAADEALASLRKQLSDIQKRAEADKADAASQAAAARKGLDDSIAQFQNNLKSAQQLKQSPELAAYVDAANRIFIQTRELTEDLIRRQENQRTQLAELKQRFDENTENSTRDRLNKDDQLKKLRDEKSMLTRQYNAANSEGQTLDATKLEMKIKLLESAIGGREDLVKNDPIYSQTAMQLQQLIDATQQSIIDDRKHIDEKLTKVQQDFALSAPAVEKLPDEQKQLADSMEKRLIAVTEARKAYDAAADDALAQQAKIEADQKNKASALQLEIAARQQEIADVANAKTARDTELARQQKLDEAQAKLASIRKDELQAQQTLDDAIAANDNAERQRKTFADSDARRNDLQQQKAMLDEKLKDATAALNRDQAAQLGLIVPDSKIDFAYFDQGDRRPIYAAGIGSALFLLLMIPVLWTLRLTSRDAHHGHPMPIVSGPFANGTPIGGETGNGFDPVLPAPPNN